MQDINDTDIVALTHKILADAIENHASDLHIEPQEKFYRLRLRMDGVLREYSTLNIVTAQRLTTRFKVLASLDISERRLPQDGHFIAHNGAQKIDVRVSCCPTIYGEKLVLRILDTRQSPLNITKLGLSPEQQQIFSKYLQRQQGMILITGPTGSGKTVTLYSGLCLLNIQQLNITTIEDPAEIHLPGINQISINTRSGLEFANTLRAVLRQDPDVIMIGEIRDLETAQIAIKASQTGHLVLATLHTSNAAQVIPRLINLGVSAYNIATAVTLIIAQRLCRVLCVHCKREICYQDTTTAGINLADWPCKDISLFSAYGCEKCRNGYQGRIGIYEIIEITPAIASIIMANASTNELIHHLNLKEHCNLQTAALQKVCAGIISLEEALQFA